MARALIRMETASGPSDKAVRLKFSPRSAKLEALRFVNDELRPVQA